MRVGNNDGFLARVLATVFLMSPVISSSASFAAIDPVSLIAFDNVIITTDAVKPAIKREFTLDIAQDELLGKMLSAKSQEEMVNIFKDKYMKDGGNTERRSNYA